MDTPREQLAKTLKQARIDAGYSSHGAIAKQLKVSRPVVSRAENPTNPVPSDDVLTAWSGITGVALDKLLELARRAKSGTPDWFVPYKEAEAAATMIRSWAPLIVPGLLQTESYARVVLSAEPLTPAKLDELLTARLGRQNVLRSALYTAILDAGVTARRMGSAAIMADQLKHLGDAAEQPNITVLVVQPDTNHGGWGALDIAARDGLATVNLTTATNDVTTTSTAPVDNAIQTYERVLGYAMNPPASLDFLRTEEERWKNEI